MNTPPTSMFVFLFNNVTSTIIILSVITLMAPHVYAFSLTDF